MATTYLGVEFDIHGGGRDLVFPHHENEIAQSQAAGDGFARYWLHNAWVTTAGEKMSKSLGNSLLVSEVGRVRPVELRWYLASAHYRSTLEFSDESLGSRPPAIGGWSPSSGALPTWWVRGGGRRPGGVRGSPGRRLNVPAAIAVAHELVTVGNTALTSGDEQTAATVLGQVRAVLVCWVRIRWRPVERLHGGRRQRRPEPPWTRWYRNFFGCGRRLG